MITYFGSFIQFYVVTEIRCNRALNFWPPFM